VVAVEQQMQERDMFLAEICYRLIQAQSHMNVMVSLTYRQRKKARADKATPSSASD
jgi:hypothetical protein